MCKSTLWTLTLRLNPGAQLVELRAEEDRFLRLLEILGLWYEKGKLLIFVGSQEKCDDLFRELLRVRVLAPQRMHCRDCVQFLLHQYSRGAPCQSHDAELRLRTHYVVLLNYSLTS